MPYDSRGRISLFMKFKVQTIRLLYCLTLKSNSGIQINGNINHKTQTTTLTMTHRRRQTLEVHPHNKKEPFMPNKTGWLACQFQSCFAYFALCMRKNKWPNTTSTHRKCGELIIFDIKLVQTCTLGEGFGNLHQTVVSKR